MSLRDLPAQIENVGMAALLRMKLSILVGDINAGSATAASLGMRHQSPGDMGSSSPALLDF